MKLQKVVAEEQKYFMGKWIRNARKDQPRRALTAQDTPRLAEVPAMRYSAKARTHPPRASSHYSSTTRLAHFLRDQVRAAAYFRLGLL